MTTINPVTVIPNDLKPNDMLGYKVIAVVYYGGFWAAYKGLTSWSDEEVAESGDKLDKKTAEMLFYAPKAAGLIYGD